MGSDEPVQVESETVWTPSPFQPQVGSVPADTNRASRSTR